MVAKNPGHVLIIPKDHVENLYDIPDNLLSEVAVLSKRVAVAMKHAYGCDGTSVRQYNEPAGDQDVWHYHFHVYPRWDNDRLYESLGKFVSVEERRPYAEKLRSQLMTIVSQ